MEIFGNNAVEEKGGFFRGAASSGKQKSSFLTGLS